MADASEEPELVSREAARQAALKAASDILRQRKQETPKHQGVFALYAWGVVAFISVLFAVTATLVPGSDEPLPLVAESIKLQTPVEVEKELTSADSIDTTVTGAIDTLTPQTTEPETIDVADKEIEEIELKEDVEDDEKLIASTAPSGIILGVDLGSAGSIPLLRNRYVAMKRRAPDLFSNMTPLVAMNEEEQELIARLVVGPFDTSVKVVEFCRKIRLRLTVDCTPTDYEGGSILPH